VQDARVDLTCFQLALLEFLLLRCGLLLPPLLLLLLLLNMYIVQTDLQQLTAAVTFVVVAGLQPINRSINQSFAKIKKCKNIGLCI